MTSMGKKGMSVLKVLRCQRGDSLAEVLVAMAILGVVAVAFLSAMVTAYHGVIMADQKTMAESLTRTEIERVRDGGYPVGDSSRSAAGYDVAVDAEYIDPATYGGTVDPLGMQRITITVSHQGEVVLITETTKVNR
ncbi:MAG: type II secretion system protein [Chloroflexi bacterium]|nr:type II secretion system protein [Chloroflexota bacterium]